MNKIVWTTNLIRKTWLDFFKNHDHLIVESQSLIPVNDNSLLWINSGVATLKAYFSGQKNPPYQNLTNSQKCIRTNDIYNVGITSRHQTFFEMLGNFSIGGYFKKEAINLAYDLLINYFKLDVNKLYITVFEDDEIAYNEWIKQGIIKNHIIKCNRDRNFWDVGSGPCGPCTEIYYDRGIKYDPANIGERLFFEDIENDRYIEIWNIVFSEFNNKNNEYIPLARKNIDTGAGIERLASILQDAPTNFDTDVFQTIIKHINKHTQLKYNVDAYFNLDLKQLDINRSHKIIADHMRAIVFALSDGATISNKDRGYILKRLLRRVIINLQKLEIKHNILEDLIDGVIESMGEYYPYLNQQKSRVLSIINKEYDLFIKTLQRGNELFKKYVLNQKLDKHAIFKLVETYGLPIELIENLAQESSIKLDLEGFNELFKHHQMISNANSLNKAMLTQNGDLLNLNTPSTFLYDTFELKAKIVALFDEEFNEVDELNDSGYIVFDQTCFYATSGGQIHDCGFINNVAVDNVIKGPNLQHLHHIDNKDKIKFNINDECDLKIDVNRRMKLMKNHSVEHLIHAALVKFIDNNIKQEGAFKSPEKVSFDFQLDYKPTENQLNQIEDYINDLIKKQIQVDVLNLSLEEAKNLGAKAYFEDVYKKIKGDLRVIKMGDESTELCGGTHVHNTADIEQFKIISCQPKGAGSWRIEAITSFDTIKQYLNTQLDKLVNQTNKINQESKQLGINDQKLSNLYTQIINHKEYNKELINLFNEYEDWFNELKLNKIKQLNQHQQALIKQSFINQLNENAPYDLFVFNNCENKLIFNAINELINEHPNQVFIALNLIDDKLQYLLAINEKNTKGLNLNNLIKQINSLHNGKGGGKANYVQGGCSTEGLSKNDVEHLIEQIKNIVNQNLS